jgi:ribosome-binding protein aMBF1 (putative translation factor)
LNTKPIEIDIFRAGTHTANNGATYTFSREQLGEVVNTYNPTVFRAPLIVSHNTKGIADHKIADKELCYGIPKYLRLVGGTLKAGFEKVAPQMRQWVKDGMLHSISSSFYLPDSPNNPYPGKMSLRHIAALGASPPAVKGLAPLELCEFNVYQLEQGVCEFSMPTNFYNACADLFQGFREYLIDSESVEVADRVLPSDAIASLRNMPDATEMLRAQVASLQMRCAELEAEEAGEDDEGMSYGEMMDYKKMMMDAGMSSADVAAKLGVSEEDVNEIASGEKKPSAKQKKMLDGLFMSSDMSEREEALRLREEAIAQKEADLEQAEITSFVEGLVKQGKVIAAKRDDTVALLLNTADSSQVSFSQGNKSPRQALMDMLNDQPSWNYGEEIVTPLAATATSPNFSAPSGYGVDKHSGDLFKRAIAFCQSNNLDANNIDHWEQALEGVTNA